MSVTITTKDDSGLAEEFVSVVRVGDTKSAYATHLNEIDDKIEFVNKYLHVMGKAPLHERTLFFGTGNHGKVGEFKAFLRVNEELAQVTSGIMDFDVLGPSCYEEIEENGTTFIENAMLKSVGLSKLQANLDKFVMCEDSGITIPILDNGPAVHSARLLYKMESRQILAELEDHYTGLGNFLEERARQDLPRSTIEKNNTDFINKICVIQMVHRRMPQLRDMALDEFATPAFFSTTATIARNGRVTNSASGIMHGYVRIPTRPDYNDGEFLRALYRDFGYNSIFGVLDEDSGNLVALSKVRLEDRLRWNHRSIALTRVIIDYLFDRINSLL
jgi:inosine/xanthosine triphosphate pyrophosphatase family protein